mmetsp:Transcript_101148/g.321185  ORF Transcript_101148/g.321185 Transcript_101148/m.321185 type:complete len:452 (+) Transcript_101148:3-1358(+)
MAGQATPAATNEVKAETPEMTPAEKQKAALAEKLFQGACFTTVASVIAHTLNLQSEVILIRDACGGDLSRSAELLSKSNAAAGLLGLIVNQIGGKLSDCYGRKAFFMFGPSFQALAGLMAYRYSKNATLLAIAKTIRMTFTTFSGTVMTQAMMRDVYEGKELAVRSAKLGGVIGIGIMTGPIIESFVLNRVKAGGERVTYLMLSALGLLVLAVNGLTLPETLSAAKRKYFDLKAALVAINPFGFMNIFTKGSVAVQKLTLTVNMQQMIDGKNMSDLSQLWMREHLKMDVTSIRNFIMGFGLASMLSGMKLIPSLVKNLSIRSYTTLTNYSNLFAFSVRAAWESKALFFGMLPFMLPGVNGASSAALNPALTSHLAAEGFGVGESSAWLNNMRVLLSVAATLIYGYCYSWCRKVGVNPGHTYLLAGILGGGIPQLLLSLVIKDSELRATKKQ